MGARLAPGLVVLGLLLSLATGPASSAAPAREQADLQQLVIKGGQVGSGYRLRERPKGHGMQDVTLEMCGFDFRSERLRTGRLQVNYAKRGAAVTASNEVVTYKTGGTQQALREVRRAAATCPRTPVPSSVQGMPPLTYRLTKLTPPRLLPQSLAYQIQVSATVSGTRVAETVIVIYQVRNNVLSGVYTYEGTMQARRSLAFHAAAESARNLTRFA